MRALVHAAHVVARLLAAKMTVGQLARALLKADSKSLQGGRALDAVLEALGA